MRLTGTLVNKGKKGKGLSRDAPAR